MIAERNPHPRVRVGARFAALLALITVIVLIAVPPIHADDVNLSVSPSLVEVRVTGGGSVTQEITVFNEGEHVIGVETSVLPYKGAEDELSAVDWLTVEPPSLALSPGGQGVITVAVTAPTTELPSGGRYAMVVVRAVSATKNANETGVSAELGVPFLITIEEVGDLRYDTSAVRAVPFLELDGSLGFRSIVANDGNIHTVASGGIELTEVSGASVGTLTIPESTAIIPGTEGLLTSENTCVCVNFDETYRFQAQMDYGTAGSERITGQFLMSPALQSDLLDVQPLPNGGGLQIRGNMHNIGEVGIIPTARFAVADADGIIIRESGSQRVAPIFPGETLEGESSFNWKLNPGMYSFVGIAEYGMAFQVRHTIPFEITEALPAPQEGWGPIPVIPRDGIAGWVITVIVVVVVFVLLTAGFLWLPVLAPLRHRLRRAVYAFGGSDDDDNQDQPDPPFRVDQPED